VILSSKFVNGTAERVGDLVIYSDPSDGNTYEFVTIENVFVLGSATVVLSGSVVSVFVVSMTFDVTRVIGWVNESESDTKYPVPV
jgi:hypothetical protein